MQQQSHQNAALIFREIMHHPIRLLEYLMQIRIKQIHSTSTEVKDVLVGLPVKIDYQPTKRE